MSQLASTAAETSQAIFEKAHLPDGWRWVRLGDVCSTTSGGTPSRSVKAYYGGSIAWVKSGELNDGEIHSTEETITEEGLSNSSAKVFPAGTLLIALYGATVGKLGILEIDAATNQAVCAIFPSDSVYRDFLFFYLLRERESLLQMSFGGAQPNISQDIVRSIKVALPPLPEQRRIAAILKEQMAAVERARAAAEAQLTAAKDLPAAYLRKVFDSSEAQRWQRKTVAQMISSGILLYHQDGNHGELHPRNKDFVASGVKFVTAKHLNGDGTLALDRAPCISQEQASGLRIGFGKSWDVLLAHNATVGPVGIAPSECEPFIVGTSLTIYRCNVERLLPLYLFVALRAVSFQRQLFDAMKQTTRNQVPITRQREMIIPIPTLSEQEKIANELTEQLQITERATQKLEEQLTSINNLPSAFLREALTGKL